MTQETSKEIGNTGEKIAVEYLKREKFQILATNYRKNVAELDVIASKKGTVHFIEVKSVSHETMKDLESAVSHGTYRPEERIDARKIRKVTQGIDMWLAETGFTGNYQFDVVMVRYVVSDTHASITHIENAHLE